MSRFQRFGCDPTAMLCLLLGMVAGGCSTATQHAGPVDQDKALQVLTRCLDAWADGVAITEVQSSVPTVVVQDMDWATGKQLQAYEFIGTPTKIDSNLLVEVSLQFSEQGRTSPAKRVTYIVGTDPVLTVFRKLF